MEVNNIKNTIKSSSTKNKNDFVDIDEAVTSLTKAVSVLESINNSNQNPKNNEDSFPEDGIDFYKATKHYEIRLIKRALEITRGHQTRAAKLLNLKLSTLNSIIKRHNIHI